MFWKSLYDSLLQFLAGSWAEFTKGCGSAGRIVRDNFQKNVYPGIGIYLFVITIIFILFYYYYLNSKFGRYYSIKSWLFALLSNSSIVFLITYLRTKAILDSPVCNVSKQILFISIINAFFAAILFLILSFISKWRSPMAKRTPF